jgi:hypothetical protein
MRQYKARNDLVMKIHIYSIIHVFVFCVLIAGCTSVRLHEREPDPTRPDDQGNITELQLRGPKVQVSHKF